MEGGKFIVICILLLIFITPVATSSKASEESNSKKITANKDTNSSDSESIQAIPCNWEGWFGSRKDVRCRRWPCSRHVKIMRMKCTDGFLTEVKADRVCVACQEGP